MMAAPALPKIESQSEAQDRARAYKSRNKRPCDFCRYKKAACHLDSNPPCELCIRYGKECTFNESPAKRRRPNEERRQSDVLLPPSSTFDISHELLSWEQQMPPFMPPPLHSDFSFEPSIYEPLMFEQFDPIQAGLAAPLNDTPQSIPMDCFSPGEPSLDAQTHSNAQVVGLSGEQDPYLLRHYRFDGNNEFISRQIRVRRVGENKNVPVHFMIQHNKLASKAQPAEGPSNADTWRRELKEMVNDEHGKRLIQLYVMSLCLIEVIVGGLRLTKLFYLTVSSVMYNLIFLCSPTNGALVTVTTTLNRSLLHYLQQSMVTLFRSISLTSSFASTYTHLLLQTHCSPSPGMLVYPDFTRLPFL